MRKTIMKSTLAVALVAAAAFGGMKTYGAYAPVSQSDLLLSENVEALSWNLFEWLTEKNHKCTEVNCSITITLGMPPVTIAYTREGKEEVCEDGNSVAYCVSCKMCSALTSI